MLRASVEMQGGEVDVAAIRDDAAAAGSGVEDAELLLAFADAAVGRSEAALAIARKALVEARGAAVLVDVAAVAANFQRMVRVADATGIPLDPPMVAMSSDIRTELSLGEFETAAHTPEPSGLAAVASSGLGAVLRGVPRWVGAVRRWRGTARS